MYTSLIATLLPIGMVEAIQKSLAKKIYIQNIMTQPAETVGLTMSEHIQALVDQCGSPLFRKALVNTRVPSPDILRKYEEDSAAIVEIDRANVERMGVDIVEADLLYEDGAIRHDPDRLARAVLSL